MNHPKWAWVFGLWNLGNAIFFYSTPLGIEVPCAVGISLFCAGCCFGEWVCWMRMRANRQFRKDAESGAMREAW